MENKKLTISGSTTILHKLRVKLGLNMSEYVVMRYCSDLFTDKVKITAENCIVKIGVDLAQVMKVIDVLLEKKMLTKRSENYYEPCKEWFITHREKGFEFGLFYQPIVINQTKISWRSSSKESAMKKLTLAMAGTSIEAIIYSKLRYFISKYESNSLDFVMGAERFVGPERNYETIWNLREEGENLLREHILEYYNANSQLDLTQLLPEVDPDEPDEPKSIIQDQEFWKND